MTALGERSPIAVTNLSVAFGSTRALDNVSWSPRRGEITALVGLNGAGKSTLMRVMTGLVRPTSGSIDRHTPPGARALSAMIEAPAVFAGLTARRNLEIHRVLTGASRDEVTDVALLVDIADVLGRRVGTLSQGYRQRVAIAIAMLGQPAMLLLDEPTNALDPAAVLHLRTVMRDIAGRGVAMVVSSHMLRELEGVAERLTVLHGGRVRYDGPMEEFVTGESIMTRAADPRENERLTELLRAAGFDAQLREEGVWLELEEGSGMPDVGARQIFTTAVSAGIDLVELKHVSHTLEDAFHATIQEPI